MILVAGYIDGRYLALAERVIERVVDLADGDPQLGGSVPVDHEIGLDPFVLLIVVDVHEVRIALQGRYDLRRPLIDFFKRRALQGELILRVAGTSAGADILHGLQKQGCSRNNRHFPTQPRDDAVRRDLAFAERLQRNEHETGIGLTPAGEPDDCFDRGIVFDDGDELRQLLLHQLK